MSTIRGFFQYYLDWVCETEHFVHGNISLSVRNMTKLKKFREEMIILKSLRGAIMDFSDT